MAMGGVQSGQPSGSGQFAIGLLIGLALAAMTVLGALYQLGYFPAGDSAIERAPIARDVPEARPTAVWRFRSEWLTPGPR
jgi:hypothetical protein